MFCTKCGSKNADTAVFCVNCGSPIKTAPEAQMNALPQWQPAPPAQSMNGGNIYQNPKKSRKGLIIGLISGGVVLIAAAVVLVILLTGANALAGLWYCEDNAEVFEFEDDGNINIYTRDNRFEGEYEYNEKKSKGVITVNKFDLEFELYKDEIETESGFVYIKVKDKDFDIDEFIEKAAEKLTAQVIPSPTPEPIAVPTPEPNPAPTPEPTIAIETVNEKEMTLQFAFGERTGVYTGEVLNGLPNGQGSFTSVNDYGVGWTYTGAWENGHFSGEGKSDFNDGWINEGFYQNDYLSTGKQYYNQRLVYDGEWLNGEYNGQGTLYDYTGNLIFSGAFTNGLISETPEQRSVRINAFKEQCTELSYSELYEIARNETGAKVQFTGTIFQVHIYEENGQSFCDFMMYYKGIASIDTIVNVVYRLSEGEPSVQEGQNVTVWGAAQYCYSYTSYDGDNISCPFIIAWSVE